MKKLEAVELTDAEFEGFEQKSSYGNFFQSVERKRLREGMGWKAFLPGIKRGDEVVGGGLLIIKNGLGLMQIGPILAWDKKAEVEYYLRSVVELCRREKVVVLEVFPPVVLSERTYKGEVIKEYDRGMVFEVFKSLGFRHMGMSVKLENKANRWMVVKNLEGLKAEDIAGTYRKNVRNKLRKVSDLLELHEMSRDEVPLMAKVADESNRKNSVVSRNLDYYYGLWDEWGDKVRFVAARRKDTHEVVAGRILFYHPNEVVSFISGTAQEFKALNGMTYLQDWLIRDSLERGIKRVNFYGVDGDFSPDNALLEFKGGFGVVVEEYIGGFRLVLRPGKMRIKSANDRVRGVARKIIRRKK